MDREQVETYLDHSGVKGMKWGVRKKRTRSSDSKKASALRKKKASELSNEELKRVTERINLEKQYKSATQSSISKGRKALSGYLTTIGKNILTNVLIGEGSKAAKAALSAEAYSIGKNVVKTKK